MFDIEAMRAISKERMQFVGKIVKQMVPPMMDLMRDVHLSEAEQIFLLPILMSDLCDELAPKDLRAHVWMCGAIAAISKSQWADTPEMELIKGFLDRIDGTVRQWGGPKH